MTNEINYKELLEVGQVYKNYKALCEHLGEKARTGGNGKKAHIKSWERHFAFTLDGHKFEITEIFEHVKDKIDNRTEGNNTVSYIDKIELLILEMLRHKDDSSSLLLSKNKILKEINIISENYLSSKYKRGRLSKTTELSLDEINDFYQSSDALLYRNIDTALKRLRGKSLILSNSVMTVGYVETIGEHNRDSFLKAKREFIVDRYGDVTVDISGADVLSYIDHRKATEDENDLILGAEQGILELSGYKTPRDAFLKGKLNQFYEDVTNYLFEHFNIYMYYQSYEITFRKDAIEKYLNGLEEQLDKTATEIDVNGDIMNRLESNAQKRHETALSKSFGKDFKNRKVIMRSSLSYLSNHRKLLDELIDLKPKPNKN